MPTAPSIVAWLWLAFVICWLVLAQFNKKASRRSPAQTVWWLRVVIFAAVICVLLVRHGLGVRIASIRQFLPARPGIAAQWAGVGMCVVGFAFAVWARIHLGRNWGMPMSLRQGHELVTSGPYALVRHPIYTGIMLAMIGAALTLSLLWLLLFTLYFTYFIVSARTEEKMMVAQFPDTYPAYRQRTRMLIPFVF